MRRSFHSTFQVYEIPFAGQVKGDGGSSCFSNVEHTGVPALQQWCHQLTVASRERAARTFLTHVKAFAQSIQSYVEGNGEVTASDREYLREKWESRDFLGGGDALGIMGQLGGDFGVDLYSINQKVDPYGAPTGVTPRLCKVGFWHVLIVEICSSSSAFCRNS